MVPGGNTARFLLVEDNPQDARLLQEAFRETEVRPEVIHCLNAEKAWKTLQEGLKAPATHLPNLILLDLNLPGTSGHEFLERMRGVPLLERLPVIILSSSQHQVDVQRARGNQAAAYMAKPLTMDGYVALANDLVTLWADGRLRA
ncbi:MAG: response regulator [Candidatus Thermoplasmatota archaeon]|jgi:CheY-like chemotaxis protein